MKTNDVKKIIYDFTKENIYENYPGYFGLTENSSQEIFWGKLKNESYDKVYITLSDKKISKTGKRFEEFATAEGYCYKKTKQILVSFGVYVLSSEDFYHIADKLTLEIIEFIENLFTEQQSTFNFFAEKGIVINEFATSDIKDTSQLSDKFQIFRKEIEIPFKYEETRTVPTDTGKNLEINIKNM